MPYNEAETRYHLIDPQLRAKGYDDATRIRLETPAPVDIEGPKGRRRKGPGRTDYLICIQISPMPAPLPALARSKELERLPARLLQDVFRMVD